jgi:hypothetical protein
MAVLTLSVGSIAAQSLKVAPNNRYLVTQDGTPFFWLADTAWELFHRCNREEADMYLEKRVEQGFNVIQAVALAELDGLNTPNPYGHLPLKDNDPLQPNEKYFEHVDHIIKKAGELGLYIALLPTWGDKVNTESWGVGPVVFNPENAYEYGKWIGNRYKDVDNVIWIIGGDRNPRENSDDLVIWNQMAEGIVNAVGGNEKALMSFHPQPKENGGSSTWFHQEEWLDFNMHQTGHCPNKGTYKHIKHDYDLNPIKPVLDAEPLYEDHPNCFNAEELGYSNHEDIRMIMYWNVFAGAFGQTYGCHDVWQMYKNDKEPINKPLRPWPKALDLPMANQVKHLKNLMLSRPVLSRIPDQSIINDQQEENKEYNIATRSSDGSYAMIYFPSGGEASLNLKELSAEQLIAWWYDPRTGNSFGRGTIERSDKTTVTAPTSGKGNDWVLVLDAPSMKFQAPGKTVYKDAPK